MKNKYIQSMKLNGADYNKTYISSSDLYGKPVNTLEFVMGPEPSAWGTAAGSKPNSLTAPGVTPQPLSDLSKFYSNRTQVGDAVITGGGTVTNPNNLFDNSMTTNATATFADGIWFGYQFGTPQVVHMYTVTCGSTIPGRPRSWVFEASNDGVNWDVLDTRTNVTFGFDTRSLGPVGTPVTKEQALTQGAVWTACGSGFAQNNTQSTMPFGIANSKAYTRYRVRVTAINSGASVEIAELEFMGFADPDTAYLVTKASGADSFTVNLPRMPVANVNVKVSGYTGSSSRTLVFTPDNFSVAQSVTLEGLGAVDTGLVFEIKSEDPTYNAFYSTLTASISGAITAGSTVTVSAKTENLAGSIKNVNAYIAMYDGNGRMVAVYNEVMAPPAGETLAFSKQITIPAGAQGYTIKVFFWDNQFIPITKNYEFR
jgi:hypothetical protein